jgi:hypothetical protein
MIPARIVLLAAMLFGGSDFSHAAPVNSEQEAVRIAKEACGTNARDPLWVATRKGNTWTAKNGKPVTPGCWGLYAGIKAADGSAICSVGLCGWNGH